MYSDRHWLMFSAK
ncbi:hypothetical protein D018_4590A, partial [Vibrio parahaemolyticus VP2007-007]